MAVDAIIPILMRRGSLAAWQSANPILRYGEIGVVMPSQVGADPQMVVGNGVDEFNYIYDNEFYFVTLDKVQQEISTLATSFGAALTIEQAARIAADNLLDTRVTDEYNSRVATDNALGVAITNEVTNRGNADVILQTNVQQVQDNLDAFSGQILNWFGLATTKGDLLVYEPLSGVFNVLSAGTNGQIIAVDNTTPLGLKYINPPSGSGGSGDMTKAVYDSNNDGVVNDSDKLGGVASSLYALKTYVDTAIANLIDSSPGTLDTLNELAAALGDDPNFATTITGLIAAKENAIATGAAGEYFTFDKTWKVIAASEISYPDLYLLPAANVEEALDAVASMSLNNASDIAFHIALTNNPHSVTKSQVGLGNVDNTSDSAKPVSTAQATADALRLLKSADLSDLASPATARTNLGLAAGATAATTDGLPEGVSNLYFLASRVLSVVLTGLSTSTNAVITAADTVLSALGKLQKQVTDLGTSKAPLASPTFTGSVIVPDQIIGDNSTKAANTAYVDSSISNRLTFAKAYSLTTLGI